LADRREGGNAGASAGRVVPAEDGHVVGDAEVELAGSGERADGELVAHGEHGGGTWRCLEERARGAPALVPAVDRDLVDVERCRLGCRGLGGGSVAGQTLTGDAVARPAELGTVAPTRAA
jgi:hypothetical protein